MNPCRYCGTLEWYVSSPDYGRGAQYAHSCSKAGMRITQMEDEPDSKDLRIAALEARIAELEKAGKGRTMKKVTKEEMNAYLDAYPRSALERDVCGIGDPPTVTYNDFTLGVWPESIVARFYLGRGQGDEPHDFYVREG